MVSGSDTSRPQPVVRAACRCQLAARRDRERRTERGCRKEPAVALVRRAMEYLRLAGEVDWIGLKCLGADPSAENTETVADQPADPCGWLGLRVRLLRWDLYAIAVANEGHEAAEGSGIASAGEAADTNNSTSMNRTERNSALPPSGNGTGPEDPNEVIRLADAVDVEEAKKRRRAGTATRIDLIALIRADDHDKHERRQQVEDWT